MRVAGQFVPSEPVSHSCVQSVSEKCVVFKNPDQVRHQYTQANGDKKLRVFIVVYIFSL